MQRERFEDYQKTTFLGRVLAGIFGMDSSRLQRLEDSLELAIFQTAWDPREIQAQMVNLQETLRQERESRLADARLMAKVESYTVSDEKDEGEAFQRALAGKTRLAGAKTPWGS